MRKGPVIATILVSFVIATSVLIYFGRDSVGTGQAADMREDAAPAEVTTTVTTTPPPTPNVAATALKPGDTPPQFVLFSLDGTGSPEVWQQFLAAADGSGAHFTAFLTGLTLIDDEHRTVYTGAGHDPGVAAAPFGGEVAAVAAQIENLNDARRAGHEIGTHYNGHFCSGNPPGGDDWTGADWKQELDQFDSFIDHYASLNGNADLPELEFDSTDIRGGRTPCLEGDLAELAPVWLDRGFTYDTSKNLYSGIGWPEQVDGIWEFQIPYAHSPAFDRNVTLTDEILRATFRAMGDDPGSVADLQQAAAKTYRSLFKKVHNGNRAPLVIGTHAHAGGDETLIAPTLEFMAEVCVRDDVICATFSEVVTWLDAQDPDVLSQLQAQRPVAAGR